MKEKFNYLQHQDAVNEILKHKWIESEKAKRNIGFATAAFDWIKNYGQEWKKANNIIDGHNDNLQELSERRNYRRFKINLSAKILFQDLALVAEIKELNHRGATLICNVSFIQGAHIDIIMRGENKFSSPSVTRRSFPPEADAHWAQEREAGFTDVRLKAKVIRSLPYKSSQNQTADYLITTLFDENTQRIIIDNKKELFN